MKRLLQEARQCTLVLTRRRFLWWSSALAGTALVSPILAACGGKSPSQALTGTGTANMGGQGPASTSSPGGNAPKVGGTWTIAITEDPDTLDPQKIAAAVTGTIFEYLGQTLVTKDFDKKIVPSLAKQFSVSQDGLKWTFVIKERIKFHDGSPLDAAAVKASMERALAPETKSPIAGSLLGPVSAIDADELTLTITLKEPFVIFLDNMSDPRSAPIQAAVAQSQGDQFGRHPISVGPWKIVEWQSGAKITLERFAEYAWPPDYLHQGPAYINQLVFRVMPEAASAMAAFESGEVDQVGINPPDVERIQSSGKYDEVKFLRNGVGLFLEFNVTKPPFDDLTVRRAMNYAIDKNQVLQVALQGLGVPAYGPLPPSIWGY